MDLWYTTVQMNYAMYFRQTYFLGTLRREQRANLPVEIMYSPQGRPDPSEVKNLTRGEFLWQFDNYGLFDFNIPYF